MNGLNLKTKAINEIEKYFDDGSFLKDLDVLVVSPGNRRFQQSYRACFCHVL